MEDAQDKQIREEQQLLERGASEVVAQVAQVGVLSGVGGAGWTLGKHLMEQVLDRPAKDPPPQIDVQEGYRPKE